MRPPNLRFTELNSRDTKCLKADYQGTIYLLNEHFLDVLLRSVQNSFLATAVHNIVPSAFNVIIKQIRLKRHPGYCSVSTSYKPSKLWAPFRYELLGHTFRNTPAPVYIIYSLYRPIYCHYLKTDNHNVPWDCASQSEATILLQSCATAASTVFTEQMTWKSYNLYKERPLPCN